MDVASMKVLDLRRELRARGRSAAGDKAELAERLRRALDEEALDAELGLDTLDALNPVATDDAPVTPTSPIVPEPLGSPAPIAAAAPEPPAKKIVLNRTAVTAPSAPAPDPDPPAAGGSPRPDAEAVPAPPKEPKSTKLVMDSKTRLEMRAKRFGLAPAGDALKEARKARFGVVAEASPRAAVPGSTVPLDVLKKRAERFGTSVSKVMVDMENEERLEKRKAKFGIVKS